MVNVTLLDSSCEANIAENFQRIITAINGAAEPELPEVSATNNGQVLTVVDGQWAAADLPENGGTE